MKPTSSLLPTLNHRGYEAPYQIEWEVLMASDLIIISTLANCGPDAPTDEFQRFLINETPGLTPFRRHSASAEGIKIRASLDWQAVLGTGADLLAFAGVLWTAYEKYVKPRLKKNNNVPKLFLYIQISSPSKIFVQFSLGHSHKDKDCFTKDFVEKVSELRSDREKKD